MGDEEANKGLQILAVQSFLATCVFSAETFDFLDLKHEALLCNFKFSTQRIYMQIKFYLPLNFGIII